jgi:hypothetical protein
MGATDFANPQQRAQAMMQGEFSYIELHGIREKMWLAKEAMREQGIPTSGGLLPMGVSYDRTTKTSQGKGWYYNEDASKVLEAFRRFASGRTSYVQLARFLGCSEPGAKLSLKNRIYTGWYIIDRRCDPSLDAKVMRQGMKQGYRRKIARDPAKDNIYRHTVLDPPLVLEELFDHVQHMVEAKRVAKLISARVKIDRITARERGVMRRSKSRPPDSCFTSTVACGVNGSGSFPLN